jgi:hypothetical protein
MSARRVVVHAGVCGSVTEATAASSDQQHVEFSVTGPCEKMQGLAAGLPAVDAYAEIGTGFEGQFHQVVRGALSGCCSGCAVPVGLFKAMQVAAGLALPAPVGMEFERIKDLRS